MEFQIILGNFSEIRGAFWDLFHINIDYFTLRCFMLSVPSEPIFDPPMVKPLRLTYLAKGGVT